VEDLLSLSRLESGEETITVKEINLEPILQAAFKQVEFAAIDKDIQLIIKVPTKQVIAEETALVQILVNLLDNAIKYSPKGRNIWVTSKESAESVALLVRDEGYGIPKEHQSRIFERFYRVDPARSRELGGTGLGLAIVKHLVQSLKGRVEVESEPEKGTIFTLTLPTSSSLL
jgi:signal transduction histidine kinase